MNGKIFYIQGGRIRVFQPWTMTQGLERTSRWSIEDLAAELLESPAEIIASAAVLSRPALSQPRSPESERRTRQTRLGRLV